MKKNPYVDSLVWTDGALNARVAKLLAAIQWFEDRHATLTISEAKDYRSTVRDLSTVLMERAHRSFAHADRRGGR